MSSAAPPVAAPAQQQRIAPCITLEGNLPYNPYGFPPPAPAPPPPLTAVMLQQQQQQQQHFSNSTLESISKSLESAVTSTGNKLTSHDFVHDLGLSEAQILANMPPGSQQLSTHLGMITDSTDKEYRARVTVTQHGFFIVAANTKVAKPFPVSFLFIPFRYLITYIRCKSVPQSVPDPARPAPRVVPSQFPAAADALRLYTSDGRLHVLYRFPIDQVINSFDYWWRITVGLVARPVAPVPTSAPPSQPVYAPQVSGGMMQSGYVIVSPSANPIQQTVGVTPGATFQQQQQRVVQQPVGQGAYGAAPPGYGSYNLIDRTNDGGYSNVMQAQGKVITPSPFTPQPGSFRISSQPVQPAPSSSVNAQEKPKTKNGYQALASDGDVDEDAIPGSSQVSVNPNDVEMKDVSSFQPPKKPLN